jgi:XapX domain-containing protein
MEGVNKMNILLALMTGVMTGFIFTFFKLPTPAPQVWAGVVSIAGVLLGSQLCQLILQR